MTCKHCGTDIAANALICYRCGHPTNEPSGPRPPRSQARPGWWSALAVLVLAAAALFMGRTTYAQVPKELSWALAGLAAIVLAWRLWMRRRR